MTDYKSEIFMLSGYRNLDRLKRKSLPPTVYMNPDTAAGYGFKEGDWIWIETYMGRIKQQVAFQEGMHPKVVNVEFGWGDWGYPEANMNLLTDYRQPYDRPTGSVTLRGYACKVYKTEREKEIEMNSEKILLHSDSQKFLDDLRQGADVLGPTRKGGGTSAYSNPVFAPIQKWEDLELDYKSSMLSPKKILFPDNQDLYGYEVEKDTVRLENLRAQH